MADLVAEAIDLPPKEAIAFLRQKTNQTTQRWTDVWNEAHSRAFMVAGAASEALVQDFRDAVAKAIETGTTLATFRKDFDAIVAKHGWVHNGTAAWRSRIIYETNLSTAYSAGRYAQMTEPDVLEAFPFWRYQHNAAIHPRQQHLDWSGLVLQADDPWWSTHYPPNGWRCHCSVSPVSEGGLRRMGRTGPDRAPPIDLQKVLVRGLGVEEVPRGIDPGFGYNPGRAWLEHADRPTVGQLPARAPTPAMPARPERPPLRADAVHVDPREVRPEDEPVLVQRGEPQPTIPIPEPPVATPEAIQAFLRRPQGALPLASMPAELAQAAGLQDARAVLPAATVVATKATASDLALLPELLAAPQLAVRQPDGSLVLLRRFGRLLLAAVRTEGGVARVVTVARSDPTAAAELVQTGQLLLGSLAAIGAPGAL